MSWGDIINGPVEEEKKLLRDDWSEQERRFKDNVKSFVDSIEVANPLVVEYPEKAKSQGDPVQSVANSPEKNEKKSPEKKESGGAFVESISRADAPQEVPRPAEPAEPEPAEPAKQTEPKDVPNPKTPEPASEDWISSEPQNPTKKGPLPSFSDFDAEGFEREMAKMSDVIERVKSFDLSHYAQQIGTFGVHVDLDAHRENPEVIASAFTLIYGAYTTVHARLMELLPIRHRIDSVVDYLTDIGVAFSKASNKERRMGQVKLALGDLIQLQDDVREVCDSYERTCKHLLSQHDMVSRLFTWHQNYLIPRNVGMRLPAGDDAPRAPSAPRRTPEPEEPKRKFEDNEFSGLDDMPSKPKMKDRQPGFVNFGEF